jgi:GGDEF domain-containing protein
MASELELVRTSIPPSPTTPARQPAAADVPSINDIYTHARALGTLPEGELHREILAILREQAGIMQGAIYAFENGRLALVASEGYLPGAEPPPTLAVDSGLPALALRARQTVSREDLPEVERGEGVPGVYCTPLNGYPEEVPVGLILVGALAEGTDPGVAGRHLSLVAEWTASSLSQRRAWRQVRARTLEDPLLPIIGALSLYRRLEEEFARARRHGLDLAIVLIRLRGGEQKTEVETARGLLPYVRVFKGALRNIDILGRTSREDTLALILTSTPASGIPTVLAKLAAAARDLPGDGVAFASAVLTPTTNGVETLLSEAENRLVRFGR